MTKTTTAHHVATHVPDQTTHDEHLSHGESDTGTAAYLDRSTGGDRPPIRSGLVRRLAIAAGLATSLVAVGPAPASPSGAAPPACAAYRDQCVEVTTLLTFDQTLGETPENITLDRHGDVYVTLLFAHTVVRLDRRGHVDRVVLPGALAAGIAISPLHPDQLTVAVSSPDAAVAGLWTVPFAAFRGGAAPSRSVALPPERFPPTPRSSRWARRSSGSSADAGIGRA